MVIDGFGFVLVSRFKQPSHFFKDLAVEAIGLIPRLPEHAEFQHGFFLKQRIQHGVDLLVCGYLIFAGVRAGTRFTGSFLVLQVVSFGVLCVDEFLQEGRAFAIREHTQTNQKEVDRALNRKMICAYCLILLQMGDVFACLVGEALLSNQICKHLHQDGALTFVGVLVLGQNLDQESEGDSVVVTGSQDRLDFV